MRTYRTNGEIHAELARVTASFGPRPDDGSHIDKLIWQIRYKIIMCKYDGELRHADDLLTMEKIALAVKAEAEE